jgi:hypothetical protein
MGKNKVKKIKRPTRSKLVKELDRVFSIFIRQRDLPGRCYTCGQYTTVKGGHAMHFISRASYRYRWDEDNVKGGCPRCNIFLKGNYVPYTLNMIREYGKEKVEEMERMKNTIYKVSDSEIMDKIAFYKARIGE